MTAISSVVYRYIVECWRAPPTLDNISPTPATSSPPCGRDVGELLANCWRVLVSPANTRQHLANTRQQFANSSPTSRQRWRDVGELLANCWRVLARCCRVLAGLTKTRQQFANSSPTSRPHGGELVAGVGEMLSSVGGARQHSTMYRYTTELIAVIR